MARTRSAQSIDAHAPVLVVGLGRFGAALALELSARGQEVMAVDQNPALVQRYSGALTHVVQADTTDLEVLRQLGAAEFSVAVCGIGTSIEASVLTTVNLVELGVARVWAKAVTPAHGLILERIGASHVILPEQDAGERAAHLLHGRMMDFMEFSEGYAIAQVKAPKVMCGTPLQQLRSRQKHGVTVVAFQRGVEPFTNAQPETVLRTTDVLILAGPVDKLEKVVEHH